MDKILGIGNALVDLLVKVENEDLLERYGLPKGTMQHVDKLKSARLNDEIHNLEVYKAPGGSAANTINGLARLGLQTGFIGAVGIDELGKFFKAGMENNGVEAMLDFSYADTGKAITLVTADSERTFATHLGAALELKPSKLRPGMFEGYDVIHLEGYLVQNHELIERAMQLAKSKGLRISLDLSSFNIVKANREFLTHLLTSYVDIVFANEEEARIMFMHEPEEALKKLAAYADIAAVKLGSKGSIIRRGDEVYKIEAFPTNVMDTTGAGDLYASGFFYGLQQNLPLERCGRLGSFLASKVIERMGAHISDEGWTQIKSTLKQGI